MNSTTDQVIMFFKALVAISVLSLFLLAAQTNNSFAGKDVASIPVPKNVIFPGQVISDALLRERVVPVEYLTRVSVQIDRTTTVGMVARTTLMPNQPIFTNSIIQPDVVRVNRPTVMEYVSGTLRITAEVMPLVTAKKGEFVRARNIHSGSIVTGIAMGDGTIQAKVLR